MRHYLGFLVAIILSSGALAQLPSTGAKEESKIDAQYAPGADTIATSSDLPALPSKPGGKSTVIGGVIRNVDPVRDQFTLQAFAGRPIKILFDERTQVYYDGAKSSLRDLHSDNRASVETVLDGTKIFALNIHMLSQSPEGELQVQVQNYNPETGELTVVEPLSRESIQLRVPTDTTTVRLDQAASTSTASSPSSLLVKGTLISIKFRPDNQGRGIASHIDILATPGSTYVFHGDILSLDLHSELLVLADPNDGKSYKIFFDSTHYPISRDLREGMHVTVTTNFDGARYLASALTVD